MAAETKKLGFFARIARLFKDTAGEMKKVVWPSTQTALNNTGVVIVFALLAALIVSLLDLGMMGILRFITEAL